MKLEKQPNGSEVIKADNGIPLLCPYKQMIPTQDRLGQMQFAAQYCDSLCAMFEKKIVGTTNYEITLHCCKRIISDVKKEIQLKIE